MSRGQVTFVRSPDGTRFEFGSPHSATGLIKVSPDNSHHTHFSMVEVELRKDGRLASHAHLLHERIVVCFEGEGIVEIGSEVRKVEGGTIIFCGRGVPLALSQNGESPLRLNIVSFPPGPEARADLIEETSDGRRVRALSGHEARLLGVLMKEEAEGLPSHQVGDAIIVADDEGESYWQAPPSTGYVTIKLASPVLHQNTFCVATQLLEPGAMVREHAHAATDEIILVVRGRGTSFVDGVERAFEAGDVVVIGREILHRFINSGDGDFKILGVFSPPGVESALRETGVRRSAGAERPENIPRNPSTERLLVEKYGFIIPGLK